MFPCSERHGKTVITVAEQRRMALTPFERQQIYDKFGGCCAYCGCEITIKERDLIRTEFPEQSVGANCCLHYAAREPIQQESQSDTGFTEFLAKMIQNSVNGGKPNE